MNGTKEAYLISSASLSYFPAQWKTLRSAIKQMGFDSPKTFKADGIAE
jgi:hypothetical protein